MKKEKNNMIKCEKCGKDIPAEAHFCPYCMTKFIKKSSETEDIIENKKYPKFIFGVGIGVLVLLVISVVWLVDGKWIKNPTSNKSVLNETTTVSQDTTDEATNSADTDVTNPSETDTTNQEETSNQNIIENFEYDRYLGKWVNEEKSGIEKADEIYSLGGYVLEILSINQDNITFNLESVLAPPSNRLAEIKNVTATFTEEEGTAEFVFDDDTWGNKGRGTLVLKEERIYVFCKVTEANPMANMSLNCDTGFWQIEKEGPSGFIDIKGSLEAVSIAKEKLGNEICIVQEDEQHAIHVHEYGSFVRLGDEVERVDIFLDEMNKRAANCMRYDFIYSRFSPEEVMQCFGESEGVYSHIDEEGNGCIQYSEGAYLVTFEYYYGKMVHISYEFAAG